MNDDLDSEENWFPCHPINDAERLLLEEKDLGEWDIKVIQQYLAGSMILPQFLEPGYGHSKFNKSDEPRKDATEENIDQMLSTLSRDGFIMLESGAIPVIDFYAQDHYPQIRHVRDTKGVAGVIAILGPDDTNDTNFGLRNWRHIRDWFVELELTPLPSRSEIEDACGANGLNLPALTFEGELYYDMHFVSKSAEAIAERAGAYAQVTDEVAPFLI